MLSLLRNVYFWRGIGIIAVVGVAGYLLVNHVIMPVYTGQNDAVEVPNVVDVPFEQAKATIESMDLKVERLEHRFNDAKPQGVVVDQRPTANSNVKSGRRVYLSVNSGTRPIVTVPRVEGMSLREAKNRMNTAGLKVVDETPDPIPSPYKNTVTRQQPSAGSSAEQGSPVTLWYSTGLGSNVVDVPDVVGMTVDDAEALLMRRNLRSVAVDALRPDEDLVTRQSRAPGTKVREGFEIRLFVTGGDEED